MSRTTLALLSASLVLAACTRSEAQKKEDAPEVQRIREVWYKFEFDGNKIGYVQAIDERTSANGRPAYHLHRSSVLTVKRQTETVRIEITTDTYFGLDGTPIRFVHDRREGGDKRSIKGERDGDVLVVRQAVGKSLTVKKIPLDEDLRLASSLEVLIADRLKVGTKMSGRAIDENEGDVLPYALEVESVDDDGVYTLTEVLGPIEAKLEMAADGTILSTHMPQMRFSQKKVTKAEAIRESRAVDLFSAALFKMPKPLPDRSEIEALVLRLSSKEGRDVDVVVDERQTGKRADKAFELTVRVQRAPTKSPALPVTGEAWAPFLKSTEYEPLDDEALRATAERVTAKATTVWEAARAINAFVHDHIENKSLARAYGSAPEALASAEGDCTEHAILFSALAKIVGIPTRLVTGLVYVGGQDNVFGYHEWVEIWSGEEWLAMDPTFGQDIADATHIKLYAGLSDAVGRRLAGKTAATAIGDLELDLVAYVDAEGKRRPL